MPFGETGHVSGSFPHTKPDNLFDYGTVLIRFAPSFVALRPAAKILRDPERKPFTNTPQGVLFPEMRGRGGNGIMRVEINDEFSWPPPYPV